jgi:two-component system sensor histidine kinase/response regulator
MGRLKTHLASQPLAALLAGLYALTGALWIYFSDHLLVAVSRDLAELTTYQTYKGWGYVLLSAGLVYGLIRLAQTQVQRRLAQLQAVSRLLRLQDEIGRAVLRKQDLPELLAAVCRSARSEFGFRLVCVGQLASGRRQFIRLGLAGPDELATLFDLNLDSGEKQSPIVDSLVQGRPYLCADLRRGAAAAPWQAAALRAGCRSLLVLPVHGVDELTGAIAFFAGETGRFGDEEIRWLEELAASLSLVFSSAELDRRRQQAERALRESEGRSHLIFENAPDAMMLIDSSGIIRQANRSAVQMLGYAASGLVGVALDALLPERLRAMHRRHFLAFLDDPKPRPMGSGRDFTGQRRDGSEFPVEISLGPDYCAGELQVIVCMVDLSLRREAQLQLERYAQVVRTSGDMLAFIDCEQRYRLVNPAYAAWLGVEPETLHGRTVEETMGAENYARITPNLARALAGEDLRDISERLAPAAGRQVLDVEYRGFRRDGRMEGVVLSIRDISELHAARLALEAHGEQQEDLVAARTAELRQQTRYLRALIDNFPFLVWLKDTGGHYLAANRISLAACGRTPEEIVGLTNHDIFPADLADKYHADDLEIMRAGIPRVIEEQHGNDEQRSWIETYKTPVFDEDGTVLGTVGFARDISERKAVDAAREQALDEAHRLAQARSDFLSNMSHELRTPLHGVIGLGTILAKRLTDPALSTYLDKMLVAARHMQEVVTDVLEVSRLEAGKIVIEPALFETAALWAKLAATCADAAREKGLDYAVDSRLPPCLFADGLRIGQILINLVSNAVKFTHQGGIRVSADVLQVRGETLRLRFEVQDTGIGIPRELQLSIFEAFEQLDASRTRRYGGTGLGLTICRRLARMMGGEVGVISQPGQGSTFWVELEVGAAEATPLPAERRAETPAQASLVGCRVLVVDDEPINRLLIQEILNEVDVAVDEAGDGETAIAMATRANYDLIFMAIRMAGLNGLETTRKMRLMPGMNKLPIIALSADIDEQTRQLAAAAGMTGFLAKPCAPEDLVAGLRKALADT